MACSVVVAVGGGEVLTKSADIICSAVLSLSLSLSLSLYLYLSLPSLSLYLSLSLSLSIMLRFREDKARPASEPGGQSQALSSHYVCLSAWPEPVAHCREVMDEDWDQCE